MAKKPTAEVLERARVASKKVTPKKVLAAVVPPKSKRELTRLKVIAALKRLHPMD